MKVHPEFEPWYQASHRSVTTTLALVTGDADIARDAADEAFARALERWHRVGQMHSPTGWTFRVALNVARRRLRRRSWEGALHRRQARHDAFELQPVDYELWGLVAQLPPRQRTAVALRYVADLPEAAIAEAMQIAPGTVSATLHSARKRLAEDLTAAQHQRSTP